MVFRQINLKRNTACIQRLILNCFPLPVTIGEIELLLGDLPCIVGLSCLFVLKTLTSVLKWRKEWYILLKCTFNIDVH